LVGRQGLGTFLGRAGGGWLFVCVLGFSGAAAVGRGAAAGLLRARRAGEGRRIVCNSGARCCGVGMTEGGTGGGGG